jgi:hypothetical protein
MVIVFCRGYAAEKTGMLRGSVIHGYTPNEVTADSSDDGDPGFADLCHDPALPC